jgi:hypothetical protein
MPAHFSWNENAHLPGPLEVTHFEVGKKGRRVGVTGPPAAAPFHSERGSPSTPSFLDRLHRRGVKAMSLENSRIVVSS